MDELLKDFLTESSEQLGAIDSQLVRFEREPSDARIVANVFRLVHMIKSACGCLNLQRLEKVAHSAEILLTRLRDGASPNAETVALMLAAIDRVKFILRALAEGRGEPSGEDDQLIAEIESAGEPRQDPSQSEVPHAARVLEGVLGSGTIPTERRADSVRVTVDSLQRLTTLVSELVLTRNQLVAVTDAASFDELRAPLRHLSSVASDLQSGLQTARMLPIARLFASLHRLVRDLSAEMGKKVKLTLRGGETEIDRHLIEMIRDPVAHIIRNAVAHGVESPEERRRLSKPEVGVIDVSVRCEAGIVSIDIADDGRGVDFQAICERSFALGLGSREKGATLDQTDLCRIVFTMGSSAGRRLGGVFRRSPSLDVVCANLRQISGSASLTNRPGLEARINLKIPLATAIVPAFILRAGDERFALPQRFVEEIANLDPCYDGVLIDVPGRLALVATEGIVPAAHLHVLMGSPIRSQHSGADPRIALKMRAGLEGFALVVDEMIEVQEIALEPLPTQLREISTFSAAAVLGDGLVVLVLDPLGLASALGLPKSDAPRLTSSPGIRHRSSSTNFVVFRSDGPTLRALPITAVARILQVGPAQIESADGECLIRDDGLAIPLIDIEGRSFAGQSARLLTALLLERGDDSLGLIVDEIVDVIDEELNIEFPGSPCDVLGGAVLRGGTIEILDPLLLFNRQKNTREVVSAKAEGAAVLVLEPAAFFQEMIAAVLDRNGYQPRAVGDLATALAALGQKRWRAVALVDVELAIAHQEEIARCFHDSVGQSPILIGLASHGGPTVRPKVRNAGLSTVLGKFDRASMLMALRDALSEPEIAA
jgi:two-component system chemotaxis sensor kinase CheA